MEPTQQLSEILPRLTKLVGEIDPDQLESATPCDDFTVRDVLNHMIVLGGSFAYWFRGEEAPELTPPDTNGFVPSAAFQSVMDDLLTAVQLEGAMERVISAPVGEMDGETFARLVAFDGVVHGWDLARSTGVPFEVPSAVLGEVDSFAREALTDEMRDGDTFKDEVQPPFDARPIERLAAFSGRAI